LDIVTIFSHNPINARIIRILIESPWTRFPKSYSRPSTIYLEKKRNWKFKWHHALHF